ncbi:GNAT family N-acetyltransferase [Tissierella sp. Yu-01]|uniref:GNAT family N-acetyltransferase n=1 Tax=Tissierella sp. Yu-01 TaxID=3035694 RepID=UPI00240D626D|nr:GNAT family N-acetyltransferase [Tissierella sp. Yu-01]WFA08968.1 GNAT family N-acetyltransferase [Tissierella sp. Yu-01]WFA08990.1 GNAT family N-acetyltransferase [Tissierella sp. Yu-01]
MRIESINQYNIEVASVIFSESWQYSHKEIVTEEFSLSFTPERQKNKLKQHTQRGHNCFIGFDNQKAVGILILDYDANEIVSIYISPDSLHQGFGSQLITFALSELDYETEIKLIVMNANKYARKFYEKNGFEFNGKTKILSIEKGLSEMTYLYRGL